MAYCDILNLEWGTNSRDTNIIDPVLVSLEERYGYQIVRSSIWYGLFKILYYRPKLLLIANDNGGIENVRMYQAAHSLGIKTATLISEGLWFSLPTEKLQIGSEQLNFWGNNLKKKQYLDLKLLWSSIKKELYLKYIPEAKAFNLKVSGGTGFDRYQLLDYMEKEEFKEKYTKKHEKIILLISYAFDLYALYGEDTYKKRDRKEVQWLYDQRFLVRDIYEELVKTHPETLFILKHHPGTVNKDDTEFSGIHKKYKNTLELQKEEEISDLISVSDLVIAFDSTVCLEAWLMGKETIFLNPLGKEFRRSILYKGCPIAESYEELGALVQEFYHEGSISGKAKGERTLCERINSIWRRGELPACGQDDRPVIESSGKKEKSIFKRFFQRIVT